MLAEVRLKQGPVVEAEGDQISAFAQGEMVQTVQNQMSLRYASLCSWSE